MEEIMEWGKTQKKKNYTYYDLTYLAYEYIDKLQYDINNNKL